MKFSFSNKKFKYFFILFLCTILFTLTDKLNASNTKEVNKNYTGFYKFKAEGKDLFVLEIIETKSSSGHALLKVTQKQSFNQPKSRTYLPYFRGTFAWAKTYQSYVHYYSGQRTRFCTLKFKNGKLVASIYQKSGSYVSKLDDLGSLTKIINPNKRPSNVTNTTKRSFGPNIKGKYILKNNKKEIVGAYKITGSKTTYYIEDDTNTEEELVEDETASTFIEKIKGTYRWSSSKGAYTKNTLLNGRSGYLEIHGGNPSFLGIRKSVGYNAKSSHWATLYKKQGSLSDLGNSIKNNVSGITGTWIVENSNVRLTFTSGVDNDLLVRYGSTVYELNKLDGSVLESYQGTSRDGEDEITVKIISGTKMQIDLGDNKLSAYRKNGGNYNKNTSKNTTNTNSINSKLFTAIAKDDETSLEEILGMGGNVNAKNASGNSLLHLAVLKNSSSIIEMLLAKGANINVSNSMGRTPLDLATQKITSENGELVTLFLDKNAIISNYAIDQIIQKNNTEILDKIAGISKYSSYLTKKAIEKGNVPLFRKMIEDKGITISPKMFDTALRARKYSIADVMISSGFDANYAISSSAKNNVSELVYTAMQAGGNADVALNYAIKKRDKELLLESIDKHSANPTSGLKSAISSKNIPFITTLLDKGADANAEFANVAVSGNSQILNLLINKGADINLGLVAAAKAKKNNVVKILLEKGADANKVLPILVSQGNKELTALAISSGAKVESPKLIQEATTKGYTTIVAQLIEAGANPQYAVKQATLNNRVSILQNLVKAGAKINDKALFISAVKTKNPALTKIFLENGADATDGVKTAVYSNAHKILKQLIAADALAIDQDLLNYAVSKNYTETSVILIDENLDTNGTIGGNTLLHIAVKNKNYKLVKALIDAKANVNTMSQGSTPIHLAVRNRREVAIVDVLIKGGADVNKPNSKGKKPLRLAKGRKIKKLLEQNGAVKK